MLEGVSVGAGLHEQMKAPELVYDVVCYDRDGWGGLVCRALGSAEVHGVKGTE